MQVGISPHGELPPGVQGDAAVLPAQRADSCSGHNGV